VIFGKPTKKFAGLGLAGFAGSGQTLNLPGRDAVHPYL